MSRIEGTFTVAGFDPTDWTPPREVGIPFGEATMTKVFAGGLEGDSVTRFLGGLSADQSTGGYVALEWFVGAVDGRRGTLLLAHAQMLRDGEVSDRWLQVIPASGTEELEGLAGSGGIAVDDDGTHRIWIDLE